MSVWCLSSRARGGTETCVSVCVRVAGWQQLWEDLGSYVGAALQVGSVPAGITHSCTCHTCIPTFPKPPCMHTYIYTCGFSNAQLCLHDQLHACMRMPHMHRSHIDFLTHSLFGRAERYYFHSGACAFS